MDKPSITYHYRGQVERAVRGGGYKWYDGFSEEGKDGAVTCPWMTRNECRADARLRGCRAKFKN